MPASTHDGVMLGYDARVLRRLFTLLSWVSLVLCAGTCMLWVRSYWRGDQTYVYRGWYESQRWDARTLEWWSGSGGFNVHWSSAHTMQENVEWGDFSRLTGGWRFEH
ncbi:MAG: hypothetical protein JWP03_416, partial [Phycisphaerales bacterium]|nr:hypothetical protein [Phycisphaerales bacterium]